MSLSERLAAFRTRFEAGGPPCHPPSWVHEPIRRATADLIESGAAAKALKAGDRAPGFCLKDLEGRDVSLTSCLSAGPLIVAFYQGVWNPYCNIDLRALEQALAGFTEGGARLLAISPQTRANGRKSQRQNRLTFQILSDPGNEVAAEFGLRFKLPEYLIDICRYTFKHDLASINGESSWTLPIPARFVIGRDGVVAYAEVNPDYTQRPDPSELLPIVRRLQNCAPSNGIQSPPWN